MRNAFRKFDLKMDHASPSATAHRPSPSLNSSHYFTLVTVYQVSRIPVSSKIFQLFSNKILILLQNFKLFVLHE